MSRFNSLSSTTSSVAPSTLGAGLAGMPPRAGGGRRERLHPAERWGQSRQDSLGVKHRRHHDPKGMLGHARPRRLRMWLALVFMTLAAAGPSAPSSPGDYIKVEVCGTLRAGMMA